jgi:hypothetical protein
MSGSHLNRSNQDRHDHTSGEDSAGWASPSEAARICGVSVDTIRRRLRSGALRGARRAGYRDNDPWRIPFDALVAAGMCPPDRLGSFTPDQAGDESEVVARLTAEVVEQRGQVHEKEVRLSAREDPLEQANAEIEHTRQLCRLLAERRAS